MKTEYQWLDKVKELIEKDKLDKEDYIAWSAHFASPQSHAPSSQSGRVGSAAITRRLVSQVEYASWGIKGIYAVNW